jgi:hypothetical protein
LALRQYADGSVSPPLEYSFIHVVVEFALLIEPTIPDLIRVALSMIEIKLSCRD